MIALLKTPIKREQNKNTFDFKESRKNETQDRRKPYCQTNFNTQKWKSEKEIHNKDSNDSRSIKHDKEIDDSKISKSSIYPLNNKETNTAILSQDIVKLMNSQINGVRKEFMTAIEQLSTKFDNRDTKSNINIDTVDRISNPLDHQAFKTEPACRAGVISSMTNTQSDYDINNENYALHKHLTSRDTTK